MAPPSSKEEADMVAPSAPERQEDEDFLFLMKNVLRHGREKKEDEDSTVDGREKELIEEAICSLGSCRARCSEMLEAARRPRVTGDLELHCLDFLEKELRFVLAGLTGLSPQHVDEEMMRWLKKLIHMAAYDLPRVIDQADPQRDNNTLLRRAARFFRRRHRYPCQLLVEAGGFYRLVEHPFRYRQLLKGEEFSLLRLHMSMFPYGYKFEKDQLVMRWLFEGIISSKVTLSYSERIEGAKAETEAEAKAKAKAKADEYFSYLIDRHLITHAAPNSRRRTNLPDEAKAWQWNDIQRATESAEMGFGFTSATLNLLAAGSSTGHGNEASRIPRRLAFHPDLPNRPSWLWIAPHHDVPNIPSLLQNIDLSQTRSLAVSGAVSIGGPLDKFANLVVLDVEGWENFGDEDLLQVCTSKMYFLRYLSVRNTRVSNLPPEIKELFSLQVLDASKTQVTELSFELFVGTDLSRLDLRGTPIRQLTLPEQILGLVLSFHALLLGGEGMINSTETATRLPYDIRRFWMLRTLATIDLGKQPASFVKALGDLRYLEVLAITWYFHQSSDRDYCDALLSSIKRWEKLESLTIHCGLGCSMEFLGTLSDPPEKLEKFKVTLGRFAGVPQWFQKLRDLSFVQITVYKLGAGDLGILRGLPRLKCLILGLDLIPKEAIVIGNEGFHELHKLSIDCPVPWLTFESEAMPKLTYLQLEFRACPMDPISVPSGISNLSRLIEVALYYNVRYANSSSVKMTVEAVTKEVAMTKEVAKHRMISLYINDTEQDDVQAVDKETKNTTGAPSGPDAGAQGDVEAVFDNEITEAEN